MQPAGSTCLHKEALLADIQVAIRQMISFHQQELEAAIKPDLPTLERIDHELIEAQKWHDSLLAEYRRHIVDHGC